jgi:hypothetical protein
MISMYPFLKAIMNNKENIEYRRCEVPLWGDYHQKHLEDGWEDNPDRPKLDNCIPMRKCLEGIRVIFPKKELE